jgi:hypothetical protein
MWHCASQQNSPPMSQMGHQRRFKRKSRTSAFPRFLTCREPILATNQEIRDEACGSPSKIAKLTRLFRR